jgi:signal transduction histidine kinase
MQNEVIFSGKFQDFFDEVENFCNRKNNENNVGNYISESLTILTYFPSANFASLYFLNQDTFDFEFNSIVPESFEKKMKEAELRMIDKGELGKSLQTGTLGFFREEEKGMGNNYLICPLIGSNGALAVIFINVGDSFEYMESYLLKLLSMFISSIAMTIDNFVLRENQLKAQEMLDQIVASRTMKLAKSKVQLGEKIETLKSDLTMTMPHEVRTPINQILGFSDYLVKHFTNTNIDGAEDYREILEDIHSSAERLKQLFENYLFFAKLTLISTNVFEIQDLQKEVTLSAEPIIYDKALMKAHDLGRGDDIQIELIDSPVAMNEEYLNKIIEEIVDNSFKYSEQGSPVYIGSSIIGKNFVISIKDEGRGMSKDQIENIDAYVQFERRAYEQQGSGLGLSIVRRILDLHNGDFYIESEPGKFTTVFIKIPIPTETENGTE